MSDQATFAKQCIANMLATIEKAEDELARLDSFAGDGDHGAGMVRGLRAANAAAQSSDSEFANRVVAAAGEAFTNAAGGASGALFGMLIATIGQNLSEQPNTENVYHAVDAGVKVVCKLGKTAVGDKTMVDTLVPFVEALGEASRQKAALVDAWTGALPAAKRGMESTADMVGKRGRSSRLGERSRGHVDPGAVSIYYLLESVCQHAENRKFPVTIRLKARGRAARFHSRIRGFQQ
ncbi:MAG: dihydroxyacetone kinase subunit DhaL [Anaerolineae bacterium]